MKITKTLFIAALAAGALLANSPVKAADSTNTPPPAMQGGRGMGMNLDRLTKALDLTDEQKPKVKEALEAQQTKMKALREDTSLSQEDRRTKGKELREEFNAKMKSILTEEQYAKFEKLAQGQRRNGPPGGGEKPKESKE